MRIEGDPAPVVGARFDTQRRPVFHFEQPLASGKRIVAYVVHLRTQSHMYKSVARRECRLADVRHRIGKGKRSDPAESAKGIAFYALYSVRNREIAHLFSVAVQPQQRRPDARHSQRTVFFDSTLGRYVADMYVFKRTAGEETAAQLGKTAAESHRL